ncbi:MULTISPECIES: TonB-dependent receptor [unclassified Pseudomonas]|uniref:TonB-dependent receptor n=1 Tax=unclassified Pseudomonas TaxID=196821 RepID=UPI0019136724|nr:MULTISPECIES: TonB-dependent receptor [unclassified Pseudomonas]MBK5477390.1 TonB-dependent receptor [Pseudomonas sp. TH21]
MLKTGFTLAPLACALALGGLTLPTLALAQNEATSVQTVIDFNIPAGPLDEVLLSISQQSGHPIAFDPPLVEGRASRSIQGRLSQEQALGIALSGSQLGFSQTASGAVLIHRLASTAAPAAAINSEPQAPRLKSVEVIGTRRSDVTALQSAAPVDVISSEQLERAGTDNLAKALETLVPSVNYPQVNGTDGVSSQRPVSLRGLAADQVLVLVNGKRRHASAFVNTKATLGRGSQAVDLSTIPVSAVDHIEVLRDGASAQYGSDAIAGVINIVLKEQDHGGAVQSTFGQYTKGDGFRRSVGGWTGFTLPGDGFLTLSGEGLRSERTSTGGTDGRQFYPTGDAREADADRHWRYGSPGLEDWNLALNSGLSLNDAVDLYGFATYQDRTGESQATFRRPIDPNNLVAVYPNGFLPLLDVRSRDASVTGGVKIRDEQLGSFDLSANYGRNRIDYHLSDSLNASLGPASPTSFNAGALVNEQTNVGLDHVKEFKVGWGAGPLVFSSGLAWRNESYEVIAGDLASWTHGTALPARAGGAQGFPGTQDSDEGRYARHVFGGYLGLEQQVTEKLQLGLAGRSEHYDDFGTTTTGKFSARYDFTPQWGLRSTLSSGYRAPTLGQIGTSATQTEFKAGDPTAYQVGTVSVNTPVARALGATDLKPEKSTSLSLGVVWQPIERASVSVDAYHIRIKDRIALSETLSGTQVSQILANQGYGNYSGVSFFTNALDTKTSGVDVAAHYRLDLADASQLTLNGAFNYSKTQVTDIKDNPGPLAGTGITLINREALSYVESASPNSKLILGADWRKGAWQASWNTIRYGTYTLDSNLGEARDQTFSAQWVSNASVSYDISQALTLTLGGNNIFDSYPDKIDVANRFVGGRVAYQSISPAGAEGAFYYVKADYRF